MRFSALAVLAVTSAAAFPREANEKGYLHLPVSRRTVERIEDIELIDDLVIRADDDVDVSLSNNQSFYAIDFELGTPPQPMSLLLDTGSSDVWVFDQSACTSPLAKCPQSAVFDSSKSSTFKNNHTQFVQQYADGTTAKGEWGQDTLKLGSTNLSDFNFAVAEQSNSTQGTAGIGLAVGETPYILGQIKKPYLNLPEQLKQQGSIQRVAYSLWLNRFGAEAGSVLFGAIDHAKFSTDLYTMPLVATEGLPIVTRFAVQMTGLSIFDSNGKEQPFASCNAPAVLDSGSTISSLPLELIEPFYDSIGAQQYNEAIYLVDCNTLSTKDGGLGIQIGGVDVTVGFSDLFVFMAQSRFGNTKYCVPGFLVSEGLPIIGDNILRTLYVVYDLESLEVGIAAAQTGSSASSSSIQALSTGIPGTRAVNRTSVHVGSEFATTPITLLGSSSKASQVSGLGGVSSQAINSIPESSASGFPSGFGGGALSMTVPTAVPETIVIGAKSSAGKAANSQPTGSSSSKGGKDSKGSKSKNGAAVLKTGTLMSALTTLVLSLL